MPPTEPLTAPRLSIIVIMLNEAEHIRARLTALAPLRAQGCEVIVVDGGSRDDSVEQARPLVDQLLVTAAGRAHQLNVGASQASSESLLFLHADTALPSGALSAMERGLAFHGWGRFDVRIKGRSPWLSLIAMMINLRSRLTGIATGDQAIFMKYEWWQKVGGFPEQPLMEDVEISRRLKRIGAPACLGAQVVTDGRRWERHGVFTTLCLMWRLRWRYWRGTDPTQLAREYRDVR